MAALLLSELRSLDVLLSIGADGRLTFDAPAGVITDEILARMRAERDELLPLVELVEERAAIAEFDGGLSRENAERLAWDELIAIPEELAEAPARGAGYLRAMIGVKCPWCGCAERLLENPDGLQCDGCGREAWRFEGDVIVRADWVELVLVDVPTVPWPKQKIEPEKKRPKRIECIERSLVGMMFET